VKKKLDNVLLRETSEIKKKIRNSPDRALPRVRKNNSEYLLPGIGAGLDMIGLGDLHDDR
jgi:hypothetical protein